jgi:hypothetical protein
VAMHHKKLDGLRKDSEMREIADTVRSAAYEAAALGEKCLCYVQRAALMYRREIWLERANS